MNVANQYPGEALYVLARLLAGAPVDPARQAALPEPWHTWADRLASASDRLAELDGILAGQPDEPEVRQAIFATDVADDADPANQPAKPPRYTLHCADEAFGPPELIPWTIERIVAQGGLTMFAGPPGSKKTYLVLDCAIHVALDVADWLGYTVSGGPVLIVDEESGNRRMKRRLRQVLTAHQAKPGIPVFYTSLAGFDLRSPTDMAELDGLMATVRPVLVVCDALVDLMPGGDENAVKDTQPVFMTLRRLAEKHQAGIIILHHTTKNGNSYRGSTAICGALDCLVMLESKPESANIDAKIEKSRDTEPFSFSAAFRLDEVNDTADFISTGPKPKQPHFSRSEDYVIRYLTQHKQASVSDIMAHADACTENAARLAVYSLVKRGIVRRCDGGGPGDKAVYGLEPDDPATRAMRVGNGP